MLGTGKVEVSGGDGKTQAVETVNIVIARHGSDIARLKGIEVDEKRIVSSTGALSLDKVPAQPADRRRRGDRARARLAVWHRLGAEVTVVEFLDRILPGMDGEVAKQFQRILERQGFAFKLGAKVSGCRQLGPDAVGERSSRRRAGRRKSLEADVVLGCIGRVPYTEGLGLKEAGVALDDRGRVQTRRAFRDQREGQIYAIGDVDRRARCWRTRRRTRASR